MNSSAESRKGKCKPRHKPWTAQKVPSLVAQFSLEERIRMIHYFGQFNAVKQMQEAWREEFGTIPPSPSTFNLWNKKFDRTGSVQQLFSTGRIPNIARNQYIAKFIEQSLNKDPSRPTQSIADELGLSVKNLRRIWIQEGVTPKAFAMAEVKQLNARLAELQKKLDILEGRSKVIKKRRKKGEIHVTKSNAPVTKTKASVTKTKPPVTKSKNGVALVPFTSAKSIQAKIAQFTFPVDEAVEQQKANGQKSSGV